MQVNTKHLQKNFMQNNTLTTHVAFALRNYIREALAEFDEESTKNINLEIEKAAQKLSKAFIEQVKKRVKQLEKIEKQTEK